MATASCQADCDARVTAELICTPGETHIVVTGVVGADAVARADRLRAAFEIGAASILVLGEHIGIVADASATIVAAAPHVASDASAIGARAVACGTAAAIDVANAAASVEVSVNVTVMLSGTIGGSAR